MLKIGSKKEKWCKTRSEKRNYCSILFWEIIIFSKKEGHLNEVDYSEIKSYQKNHKRSFWNHKMTGIWKYFF